MPGLIDTHVHAPQYPNVGLGYDKTLLEWLETYTFPLEASYGDEKFATRVYEAVVVSEKFNWFVTRSLVNIFLISAKLNLFKKKLNNFTEKDAECWNNYCLLLRDYPQR